MPFIMLTVLIDMVSIGLIIPVLAPLVGTFYAAAEPGARPFASVGDTVKKGQVLCIIEAMKLMNEIEADRDGVIKAALVETGQREAREQKAEQHH